MNNNKDGTRNQGSISFLPSPYRDAFQDTGSLFICHYCQPGKPGSEPWRITRGEFLDMSLKAAGVLFRSGLKEGDRFINGFGANDPIDLAFRLAAAMTGTSPVTINWQADTGEIASYKAEVSRARLVLADNHVSEEIKRSISSRCSDIVFYGVDHLDGEPADEMIPKKEQPGKDMEKIIIFTSGTTGKPKGVMLTYGNYDTNAETFRRMFRPLRRDPIHLVMVNPLHHTNSSALADWFMREPGAVIHLVPRYTTPYWNILAEVAEGSCGMVLAPGVSRHLDFLENLAANKELPLDEVRLRRALSKVTFLLGSAPVGPATVERARKWTGRLPLVRFGSTETCLQVIGTPTHLKEEQVLKAFEAGWKRAPSPGYYIGRPHSPCTSALVVKSTTPGEEGYMQPCVPDEEGLLVARGGNLMLGYLADPEASDAVLQNGWYLGFGDICFYLLNRHDGKADFYWVGRESALLIRGGANYSCDQIAVELSSFLMERYHLEEGSFDLAVVGLRIDSEHEDTCCVTIDDSRIDPGTRQEIKSGFLEEATRAVSKGARPQRLKFGPIPRNFKGSLKISELRQRWINE